MCNSLGYLTIESVGNRYSSSLQDLPTCLFSGRDDLANTAFDNIQIVCEAEAILLVGLQVIYVFALTMYVCTNVLAVCILPAVFIVLVAYGVAFFIQCVVVCRLIFVYCHPIMLYAHLNPSFILYSKLLSVNINYVRKEFKKR